MPKQFLLPFNPQDKIFCWGPIPGKFFYTSSFVETHYKYFRLKYKENWPETIFLFRNGRMFWMNDERALEKVGKRIFIKYILPKAICSKICNDWQKSVSELMKIETKIDKLRSSFRFISNNDFLKLWNNFHAIFIKFWTVGSIPELANYGSISYLEQNLKPYISDPNQIAYVLETLTAPTKPSFYQDEEIELSISKNLHLHQSKYFWLKNSYTGTQILPINYFIERKKSLNPNLKNEIKKKLRNIADRKKYLQKKYRLSAQVMKISNAISDGINWQDYRKKHIFISLHYLDVFRKEIARRKNYKISDFDNLWHSEIAKILNGENLRRTIVERKKGFGVRFFHDCELLSPKQTVYVWNAYEAKNTNPDQTMVKGIVASKGDGKKIKGRVRILFDPKKSHTFKKGEILVTSMTSPEYIFAMKKASAILTDAGGLTSHAAIVSRELRIPCLVGTKFATKIFKNKDLVEIDPYFGIAKKL